MNIELLQELIPKWFVPLKGKRAQSEFTREMTRRLEISPDSIIGFPTVSKVRDSIRIRLSILLIQHSKVSIGDIVTYHKRVIVGQNTFGWDQGNKCIVVGIARATISLQPGTGQVITSAIPLYCRELLEKVGIKIDFPKINELFLKYHSIHAE